MCLLEIRGNMDTIRCHWNGFIQWSPLITTPGNIADWKRLSCKDIHSASCNCLMQYNTVVCNTGIVLLILGCCLPHLFTDNPLLAVWERTLILVGMIAIDTKDQLHRRDRTLKLSTRVRLHGAQCTYLGRPFVINGLDWSCKWNVVLLIIKTKGIGYTQVISIIFQDTKAFLIWIT